MSADWQPEEINRRWGAAFNNRDIPPSAAQTWVAIRGSARRVTV